MSFIDTLINVDRFVIAGLKAYDEICDRAWNETASALKAAGRPDDEIAEAAALNAKNVTTGRGKLHRDLWLKMFPLIISDQRAPDTGGDVEGE
ncbi:hypothetical protein [Sphingopyxis granuli]|uniref:hypothetical protein n=1 Tax=Sphingopyxis granuli TaxID=267128 RepID=UPI001BB0041E|nr:hypothetical protein [Sphingopyxis granuli]QUM70845.1 hypothetical protein ICN83_10565 [Sphingopyxis granuli]